MKRGRQPQRGAALLSAMVVVALIATLASAALWQQWRQVEIETAERGRSQTQWMMTGVLDWSRLILREDARASTVDHLAEPWAVPLQETRLSSFLNTSDDGDPMLDAFLSGRISDEQGKLNLRNLVDATSSNPRLSQADAAAFDKLFNALGLPPPELLTLENNLVLAWRGNGSATAGNRPLQPQRYAQLGWLGLSQATLQALAPYATWLPQPTPLNLNTASALVLASIEGIDLPTAQTLASSRPGKGYPNVAAFLANPMLQGRDISPRGLSVNSRQFRATIDVELHGQRLRLVSDLRVISAEQVRVQQRTLLPGAPHAYPLTE